jgi:hypothetical protein
VATSNTRGNISRLVTPVGVSTSNTKTAGLKRVRYKQLTMHSPEKFLRC